MSSSRICFLTSRSIDLCRWGGWYLMPSSQKLPRSRPWHPKHPETAPDLEWPPGKCQPRSVAECRNRAPWSCWNLACKIDWLLLVSSCCFICFLHVLLALSTCANAKIWAETFCSRDGLVYSFWLGIAASIVCNVSQRQFPRQIHLIPVLFEKAAGRTNPQGTFWWSTSSLCQFVSWVCLPHVLFFLYVSQSSNQDPVFQKFTQSKCGHFVLAAAFRSECVLAGDGPSEDSGWCHFSRDQNLGDLVYTGGYMTQFI